MNMYSSPMNMNTTSLDKGKGKGREIDFEAAFAEVAQNMGPSEAETARIVELDDTANLEEAMSRVAVDDPSPMGADFKS